MDGTLRAWAAMPRAWIARCESTTVEPESCTGSLGCISVCECMNTFTESECAVVHLIPIQTLADS